MPGSTPGWHIANPTPSARTSAGRPSSPYAGRRRWISTAAVYGRAGVRGYKGQVPCGLAPPAAPPAQCSTNRLRGGKRMTLARIAVNGSPTVILRGERDAVATVGGRAFADLPELLEAAGGDPGRIQPGAAVSVDEQQLLSP